MIEESSIWHIIPERMKELGHGENYFTPKLRHFTFYGKEVRTIDAYNEYFFLIKADLEITISSEFGAYALKDDRVNEQQYEHQGKITITNRSKKIKHVKFYQVIPKHSSDAIYQS